MKTGILLSVREKATRLPGKVLKPLGDCSTVTEFLLKRLKSSKRADVVILSTSIDERDSVLCNIANQVDVKCFKGSEDDKLLRYRDTANEYDLDFVVIVDGDDPFVSVEHIDNIIQHAELSNDDYIIYDGLPLGATGFGLRVSALEKLCSGKDESDTEVWGHLFTQDDNYKCHSLLEEDKFYNKPQIRMTLDYPEDYEFFVAVMDKLRAANGDASFRGIMEVINSNPELTLINQHVQAKYEEHIKNSIITP